MTFEIDDKHYKLMLYVVKVKHSRGKYNVILSTYKSVKDLSLTREHGFISDLNVYDTWEEIDREGYNNITFAELDIKYLLDKLFILKSAKQKFLNEVAEYMK